MNTVLEQLQQMVYICFESTFRLFFGKTGLQQILYPVI